MTTALPSPAPTAPAEPIPCSAPGLLLSLRRRRFAIERDDRIAALAVVAVVLIVAPFTLLVAPAVTAIVLGAWAIVGAAVVLGQAWLATDTPARNAMQLEMVRLIKANAARVHPARLAGLRARAAALEPAHPAFGAQVTHLLLDLREATGEAWTHPCPERRRLLPLPF